MSPLWHDSFGKLFMFMPLLPSSTDLRWPDGSNECSMCPYTLVLNCSLSPSSWAALPDNWLHSDQDQFMHKSYIEVEYVCAISTASWWCSHCPDCILSVNLCVLTVGRCPLLLCAYSEQNGSIGFAYRLGSESLCSWPVRWHRWRYSATNIFKIWRSSWRYA